MNEFIIRDSEIPGLRIFGTHHHKPMKYPPTSCIGCQHWKHETETNYETGEKHGFVSFRTVTHRRSPTAVYRVEAWTNPAFETGECQLHKDGLRWSWPPCGEWENEILFRRFKL